MDWSFWNRYGRANRSFDFMYHVKKKLMMTKTMGNSVAKEQFLKKAQEELIEEEYERLTELLTLQKH